MDPLDKHLKSLIKGPSDDGTIDVNLHMGDINALMECLDFASMAAKYLGEAELKKGSTQGVRKMSRIQRDAKELANILAVHLDIGQPETKDFN